MILMRKLKKRQLHLLLLKVLKKKLNQAFTVFSKAWKVTLSLQKYPTTDLIPDYEEINSYTNEYKIFINIEHPCKKVYV